MLELLLVSFFYALALLVVVIYFARTTWACQKRESQMLDAMLAMKFSQSKETIPLAHAALDREKDAALLQSNGMANPIFDTSDMLQS